MIIRNIEEN